MEDSIKIGNRNFDLTQGTHIVGILNVTPDSFSDGGKFNDISKAIDWAKNMIDDGVDIIDVGGESTRPNHIQISAEQEINRVLPILIELRKRFNIPLSLDTYKSDVLSEAIKNNAVDLVNDVWGLKQQNQMSNLIAKNNLPCILMHNRTNSEYSNFLSDVKNDLTETLQIAKSAGIDKNKIILDVGIGFAKNLKQNLKLIANLDYFKDLDCPTLLGASRKSVVGLTLDVDKDNRLEGTLTTSIFATLQKVNFVRVHDIKENIRAIKMANAILANK